MQIDLIIAIITLLVGFAGGVFVGMKFGKKAVDVVVADIKKV